MRVWVAPLLLLAACSTTSSGTDGVGEAGASGTAGEAPAGGGGADAAGGANAAAGSAGAAGSVAVAGADSGGSGGSVATGGSGGVFEAGGSGGSGSGGSGGSGSGGSGGIAAGGTGGQPPHPDNCDLMPTEFLEVTPGDTYLDNDPGDVSVTRVVVQTGGETGQCLTLWAKKNTAEYARFPGCDWRSLPLDPDNQQLAEEWFASDSSDLVIYVRGELTGLRIYTKLTTDCHP